MSSLLTLGKAQTSLTFLSLNRSLKGECFMVNGSRFKVITENAKEIAQNIEKGAEKKMKKGIIKKKKRKFAA